MTENHLSPAIGRIVTDVRRLEDADGRLPLPDMSAWNIFPFEGALRVKPLQDPVFPEPARAGEPGGRTCFECAAPGGRPAGGRPLAPPGSRGLAACRRSCFSRRSNTSTSTACCTNERSSSGFSRAASSGPFGQWTASAACTSAGTATGCAHFHLWFSARPAGLVQTRGSCLTLWEDVLPKRSPQEWQANLALVRDALVADGGLVV
ncbi:MAG TPA: hypothetical protein VEH29_11190 [Acidimicrobiales bacterium]|nr:hypothetical protein [Acidimicrobiales bacterium]